MQLLFKSITWHSHDTATFAFTPQQPTSWIAGQSIKLEMPGSMYGPQEHRFTISAAPHKSMIAITTRNSGSAYKRQLFSLRPHTAVRAFAIDGDFVWRTSPHSHIWVAAGIGITPFYAMATDRDYKQLSLAATLIYSSREDTIFREELHRLASRHAEFFVHHRSGRIEVDQILALPNVLQRLVYVSGPSSMVDDLGESLLLAGLPERQLVRDWFTGRLDPQG